MTHDEKLANLRELVEMLGKGRHFTMRDAAEVFVAAGELREFDFAIPQDWLDDYWNRTGEIDRPAVVWAYDGAATWGKPFALTAKAYQSVETYERWRAIESWRASR